MKNTLKRFLSLALAVMLTLAMVPTSHAASVTDLQPGDYYVEPVARAVNKGIAGGTGATTFEPGKACIRVQVVTSLHRAANPAPKSPYAPADEFQRAIWYDFLPKGLSGEADAEKPVTWTQYCQMISNMIALYRPEMLGQWQEMAASALESKQEMTRDQGCVALYKAMNLLELRGENTDATTSANPHFIAEAIGRPVDHDYRAFFGDDTSILDGSQINPEYNQPMMYVDAAFKACHQRVSLGSYAPLFTSEKKLADPFILRDALLSVTRLYESDADVAQKLWLQRIDVLNAELDEIGEPREVTDRRNAILNSPTTIVKSDTFIPGQTYTGTAYYVSNSGDDSNDGLSPETAWATLEQVSRTGKLREGDIVFFERGGTYRGNLYLWAPIDNLTISAYGEGPKPIITSSLENAADPAKWELYSDQGGRKIWKFYREITDCSVIVLDDSTVATKKFATWSGSAWVNEDGSPYDVKAGLSEDLRFFNDDSGKFGGKTDWNMHQTDPNAKKDGPLYLRCDQGNPGELYDSIELCAISVTEQRNGGFEQTTINPGGVRILDNLSVRYYYMFGSSVGANCVVQNCEFAWGGSGNGSIMGGKVPDGNLAGDALVTNWVRDLTVRNNYFHDIFCAPVTSESYTSENFGPLANLSFTGNLVERGDLGVNIDYWEGGGHPDAFIGTIENLRFTDNIFHRMGLGWATKYNLQETAWTGGAWPYCLRIRQREHLVNCSITDNRFYYPLGFVFYCGMDQENMPQMAGNEFYFSPNSGNIAYWRTGEKYEAFRPITHDEAERFLRDFCSDTTSTIHYAQP